MKIFTQESIIQEVAEGMERNLIKNAYAEQQVETCHRSKALERLAEAAELFERVGNIEKASQLTDLIVRLASDGKKRELEIINKIASLEKSINIMQKLYNSNLKDIDKYIITSTANKITGVLSRIINTTSNINESILILKSSYSPTPNTLKIVNEVVKIADGTLAIVLDNNDKTKPVTDLVEILKNFGFEADDLDDLDDLKAEDDLDYTNEYWEK